MKKTKSFILSLLLTTILLIVLSYYHENSSSETATVSKVIDGDTLRLYDERTVRLININTPEKDDPNHALAYEYLKSYENREIKIESTGYDKYERVLAKVYSRDGEYINLKIVENGLGSKFLVQKDEKKKFYQAEEGAISKELGIWKKSEYSGCLKTNVDEDKEILTIIKTCTENFNYYIKDESRKIYHINNMNSTKITLHSKSGKNNLTDFYWNSESDIWNNDADTVYVFDSNGRIIFHEAYGY